MSNAGYGQNGIFWGFARKIKSPVTGKTAIFWDLPVIGRSAANLIKESNSRSQLLPSALHFPKTDSKKNPRSKRNEDFLFATKPLLNS